MKEPDIKPNYKLVAINYVRNGKTNKEKAARDAGYSKAYARGNAHKLFDRDDVKQYIEYLESDEVALGLMSLNDWKAFLCDVIRDCDEKTVTRLRAAELYGKSIGAFREDW